MAFHPDGLVLSNGPGNPEDVTPVIELVRQLRGRLPIFGICMGHQLISLAYGARTFKMKFGHRGGNHPVKNLVTGKLEITSQNHSYAVDVDSLAGTGLDADARQPARRHGRGRGVRRRPGFLDAVPPRERFGSAGQRLFVQEVHKNNGGAQKMPKRKDIKKVLVIGSGPIVIGQAAEFDYAGTQACLALKEEGYEVILANSNPATIMTDTHIADKVYMEPLTLEYVAKIIRFERPDAIVPGAGRTDGPEPRRAAGQEGRSERVPGRDSGHVVRVDRARRGPRAVQGAVRVAGRAGAAFAHRHSRSRRPWRRPRRSAIRWCCALPSRWAARAAALPTTRTELREMMRKRPYALARAPGAGREEHQGL